MSVNNNKQLLDWIIWKHEILDKYRWNNYDTYHWNYVCFNFRRNLKKMRFNFKINKNKFI